MYYIIKISSSNQLSNIIYNNILAKLLFNESLSHIIKYNLLNINSKNNTHVSNINNINIIITILHYQHYYYYIIKYNDHVYYGKSNSKELNINISIN